MISLAAATACGSPPPASEPAAAPAAPRQPAPAPAPAPPAAPVAAEDPYLWLEEVTSERALAWVRERNQASQAELEAAPGFAATRDRIRGILDSKDKLPYVTRRGGYYYNTWTDAQHPRGLVRRTTLAEYRKPAPAWEPVLDIDALAAAEREPWVYRRMTCLYPKYDRCMVELSRGGADATTLRELDVTTKAFVDGGFAFPEAKTTVAWKDRDTLYLATDFGPDSMTTSGYPRIVKEVVRGKPLADAVTVYQAEVGDVAASAARVWSHGKSYDLVEREITAFTSETFVRGADGKLTRIEVPLDAKLEIWSDQLLVTLRTAWTTGGKTWPAGALLATAAQPFFAGERDLTMLFEPSPTRSLDGITRLKTALIVSELEDVHNKLIVWRPGRGGWRKQPFTATGVGALDSTRVIAVDPTGLDDSYWMISTGFVTPSTLSLGSLGSPPTVLKRSPAFFDAKGLVVTQHFAVSKDGTRVPYFMVARAGLALDASHPTLLYGYGGFEISLLPFYGPGAGVAWLEHGGVYVVANIRGGGEYGPTWHQAALTHHRQRAYDDFIAVAEDLIARKVTSTPHLGIQGGSNGGLLTGVMLTQRPDLFGAVVCSVPLLDMKRYHKLLAGASWMEEYGDPEKPEDWAALARFSPYQNVRAGTKYPRTLFTSSTRDDRVHPGHARKMVARMVANGNDVLYYENIEGGHGGAANNEQRANLQALEYTFLARQLGLQ
jgi:prolyl oligopeptidase